MALVVIPGLEVRHDRSACAEAGVETAVGVVPREDEVVVVGHVAAGGAGCDDLAVRLHRDTVSADDLEPLELRRHLPATAEARVETAIRVVAGNGQHTGALVAAVATAAQNDDLSARIERHGAGNTHRAERRCDLAAVPEAPVKAAIRVETCYHP